MLAGILVPHVVCTIFIAARTLSRLSLLRKWFLDDTLIILAWLSSTAVCIVYSIAASMPNIRNAIVVSTTDPSTDSGVASDYESIRPYLLRTYMGLIFYQLCLCLTKLSILAFYLRIFSSRPVERRLAWGTVNFVLLYGIPLLFMSVFQCHPTAGLFFGQPMKCFSFVPLLIASASLHTATDAWLIILIVHCVIRLDLPKRQKIALAVVLSLSVFVIAASMTRLQLSLRANYRPSGASVQVASTLVFFVMTILECDIALICASAPTLRPVLAHFWPRLGLGEPHQLGRGVPLDEDDGQPGSANLTAVSYHGYPWTEPSTPQARSKNPSIANLYMAAMPIPPLPALTAAHRTPTTLSLRSFMSSMTPRSRGATINGRGGPGEDRAILLGEGPRREAMGDLDRKRSNSVGFEGYYDQYAGYGEQLDKEQRRRSRTMSSCLEIGAGRDHGHPLRWTNSEESFVLGVNDPASPNRLSPVSDSDLSGTTYRAMTDRDTSRTEKTRSVDTENQDILDEKWSDADKECENAAQEANSTV